MGFYSGLELQDKFPVDLLFNKRWLFIHDFFAPFFFLLKTNLQLKYTKMEKPLKPEKMELTSRVKMKIFRKEVKKIDFKLIMKTTGIEELTIMTKNKKITAICEN